LRRYNIKLNGKDIEDLANLLLWRQYERDHPDATVPKTSLVLPRLAKAEILPPRLKLVNHQWVYSFIKRINPDILPIADEQIDSERAQVSAAMMQHWFDSLEPVIKQIKHGNIYNFDETGFILGQQPSRTRSIGRKKARAEVSSTRESLTSIEYISADGFALPPFFIFTGSVQLERWFDESLDPDWVVSTDSLTRQSAENRTSSLVLILAKIDCRIVEPGPLTVKKSSPSLHHVEELHWYAPSFTVL
jgi:hypothetical protein